MRETEDGADPCQAIPDGDHDFDVAEGALAHMRHASRTVLAELSTVLDVLRSEEQGAEHASTTVPPPGLSRLAAMLDSPAAVGLRVEHLQEGEARTPPALRGRPRRLPHRPGSPRQRPQTRQRTGGPAPA